MLAKMVDPTKDVYIYIYIFVPPTAAAAAAAATAALIAVITCKWKSQLDPVQFCLVARTRLNL